MHLKYHAMCKLPTQRINENQSVFFYSLPFYLFYITHITWRGSLRRGGKCHKTTKTNSKGAPSYTLAIPAAQQCWRSCLYGTALEQSSDNTIISRFK